MFEAARQHTVKVWGKPHEVVVYQKSQTVWIAVADYMGQRFEAKGKSWRSALTAWRRVAEFRGN